MGAPGSLAPGQLSLSALCPAAMNKNRINLRQSRFSCLRSFVRFFLLALKGSPNSSRQLELEPSPGCTLLRLPLPPPFPYLLPVPPLCLSIVSIRNARVTGSARLPFSCFSPGDFTTPTAACQRERERERKIGTGTVTVTEVPGAMANGETGSTVVPTVPSAGTFYCLSRHLISRQKCTLQIS